MWESEAAVWESEAAVWESEAAGAPCIAAGSAPQPRSIKTAFDSGEAHACAPVAALIKGCMPVRHAAPPASASPHAPPSPPCPNTGAPTRAPSARAASAPRSQFRMFAEFAGPIKNRARHASTQSGADRARAGLRQRGMGRGKSDRQMLSSLPSACWARTLIPPPYWPLSSPSPHPPPLPPPILHAAPCARPGTPPSKFRFKALMRLARAKPCGGGAHAQRGARGATPGSEQDFFDHDY